MVALSDLRRRWLLVVTATAAAAGVAAGFSFTAAKHYPATAVLVVAPVPASDPTYVGIDVLRDTTRASAAATAARLVKAPEVAEAVRVKLGLHGSDSALLDKISAHVVGTSDAVAVTATDTSAPRAAQIANGFVDAFVTARSSTFQSEVASAITRLQQRIAELPPPQRVSPLGVRLQQQLADLRALLGTPDPTVRHGSEAVQPASASWPHPVQWTIYAALIGLGAGCLVALLLGVAGRQRRREVDEAAGITPQLSDRALDRLADRLERRLGPRLDALAAAASSAAPAPAPPTESSPEQLEDLERRERELVERVASVQRRELELARRSAQAAAETGSAAGAADREARGADLEARAAELETREREFTKDAELLARRDRALAQRAAELERLEQRLDAERRATEQQLEELARREAALGERETAVVERETEPPQPLAPPPVPVAAPAPPAVAEPEPEPARAHAAPPGGWNLEELERLVEERAAAHPQRADEWRSYLFYLRDYVDADGHVPHQFDWLVEDTFGELLVAR